jgi:hypothetical protein
MKILHFVDAAGSDETFLKADNFVRVRVDNNTSVICMFTSRDGDFTPDTVDITVTADKADEVALKMAEYMVDGSVGHGGIIKFIAGSAPLEDASAIEFTAGS